MTDHPPTRHCIENEKPAWMSGAPPRAGSRRRPRRIARRLLRIIPRIECKRLGGPANRDHPRAGMRPLVADLPCSQWDHPRAGRDTTLLIDGDEYLGSPPRAGTRRIPHRVDCVVFRITPTRGVEKRLTTIRS